MPSQCTRGSGRTSKTASCARALPSGNCSLSERQKNGRLTDSLDAHHDVAREMKSYLEAWESLHQEVKSTQPTQGPSAGEIEILKSLGYLN